MRVRTALAGALVVVGSGAVGVGCGDGDRPSSGVRAGDPEFLEVYVIETPVAAPGADTGAATDAVVDPVDAALHMKLVSPVDDAIVSVDVAPEVAAAAELRSGGTGEPSPLGGGAGAARIERIERVELPAGETVLLAEGGDHVSLVGLVEPLRRNDVVELDVSFERAGERHLRVVVRDARALSEEPVSG